jgi:hypothetical protein
MPPSFRGLIVGAKRDRGLRTRDRLVLRAVNVVSITVALPDSVRYRPSPVVAAPIYSRPALGHVLGSIAVNGTAFRLYELDVAENPGIGDFKDAVACLEERRGAGAQRAASQRPQEQSGAAAALENPPLDASSRKVRRATSVARFMNTFALRRLISPTTKSTGSRDSVVSAPDAANAKNRVRNAAVPGGPRLTSGWQS